MHANRGCEQDPAATSAGSKQNPSLKLYFIAPVSLGYDEDIVLCGYQGHHILSPFLYA